MLGLQLRIRKSCLFLFALTLDDLSEHLFPSRIKGACYKLSTCINLEQEKWVFTVLNAKYKPGQWKLTGDRPEICSGLPGVLRKCFSAEQGFEGLGCPVRQNQCGQGGRAKAGLDPMHWLLMPSWGASVIQMHVLTAVWYTLQCVESVLLFLWQSPLWTNRKFLHYLIKYY